MPQIEGFRIQNYRALRDVALGRTSAQHRQEPLTPFTAVIGRNGTGKSTLFDALGFVSDCLSLGVEDACEARRRGGYDRLRSAGRGDPIRFEIRYREAPRERSITYELAIGLDGSGRPSVRSERLRQRRPGRGDVRPFAFLHLDEGKGAVWAGDAAPGAAPDGADPLRETVELTDPRQLGIATLGTLKAHPRIAGFRDFLKGWHLSEFRPDAARSLPAAGPQRHLNVQGDNIGNVVQFMEREHGDRLKTVLARIAAKVPGIDRIDTHVTEDRRVLLRFGSGAFEDPFYAQQMSDGTLKLFAYLLLLEDPEPPPFICIEEPENGLYPQMLALLAREFRDHAGGRRGDSQILVTTHQPYFVDALRPEEVWFLEKDEDGFSKATRASDVPVVNGLVEEGLPLGSLWYSEYLDGRPRAP